MRRNEAAALTLVNDAAVGIPAPKLHQATFSVRNGVEHGSMRMDRVEGCQLDNIWDGLDDSTKARICEDIWGIVDEIRRIPKPAEFSHLYQCAADGSPSTDVLIQDLCSPPRPILDDDALRARIYERYLHYAGSLYEGTLPSMLPRSEMSVFTHGDLTPRNIIVDPDSGRINGVIDWEDAGWFPDYWEYVNMMRPSNDWDWMRWMDRTKPTEWDISGITKARKVLF